MELMSEIGSQRSSVRPPFGPYDARYRRDPLSFTIAGSATVVVAGDIIVAAAEFVARCLCDVFLSQRSFCQRCVGCEESAESSVDMRREYTVVAVVDSGWKQDAVGTTTISFLFIIGIHSISITMVVMGPSRLPNIGMNAMTHGKPLQMRQCLLVFSQSGQQHGRHEGGCGFHFREGISVAVIAKRIPSIIAMMIIFIVMGIVSVVSDIIHAQSTIQNNEFDPFLDPNLFRHRLADGSVDAKTVTTIVTITVTVIRSPIVDVVLQKFQSHFSPPAGLLARLDVETANLFRRTGQFHSVVVGQEGESRGVFGPVVERFSKEGNMHESTLGNINCDFPWSPFASRAATALRNDSSSKGEKSTWERR
ncbi:hypothetical protein ACHAXS_005516 [Conticribra weissflogii]